MTPLFPSHENGVADVSRIGVVSPLLKLLADHSGMGFITVARVTDERWTACAVRDHIDFGVPVGGELQIDTTLCRESRATRRPVVIAHASAHEEHRDHITARTYGIESCVSVPIVLSSGEYFGNLCALDPKPVGVDPASIVAMFSAYAALIATQLEAHAERVQVDAALLDAQQTAELREQFVAVLGHDLRGPLSAISLLGQTLARHGSEVDVAAYGTRIAANALRMSRLVDDVLDFARVRMGSGLDISFERLDDLGAALAAVVQEVRDANPQCQLSERIALPGTVFGNRSRLQQLLSNLLNNAVRHGDNAQPIAVDAHRDGADVVLHVTNGGPEIPASARQSIFEPYRRPIDSTPGGGLGLGLHICKQIAGAHGGTLAVSSTPQATTFTARWPAAGAAGRPD